jgi:uncharacterized protein (UPF0333 family)
MFYKYVKKILKSKKGVISIEYALGLAIFGIMLGVSFSSLGGIVRTYMIGVATKSG